MDLLNNVIAAIKNNPDAGFGDVFDPGTLHQLAQMPEKEYEAFRLQYQASCIMNGLRPKFSIADIDQVVTATAQRIRWQRKNLPTTPLGKACPNAPDAKGSLVVPAGFWLSSNGVGIMDSSSVPGDAITNNPIYIAAKILNEERGRMLLEIKCYSHGKWRSAYVTASQSNKALVRAVKDLGALVLDEGALAEYLQEYKIANWSNLPVLDRVPGDELFEEFAEFVLDNIDHFAAAGGKGKPWGKFVQGQNDTCIAVLPCVVSRFLKSRQADVSRTLVNWRDKGYLVADSAGKTTRTVSFQGYKRRMVVFADFATSNKVVAQVAGRNSMAG